MRDRRSLLFAGQELRARIEEQRRKLQAEIGGLETERILQVPEQDLVDYFVAKYEIECPVLHLDKRTADQHETQVDVRSMPTRYWIDDPSRPHYVPGQQIDIEIPFAGDASLFNVQPSTWTSMQPEGRVSGQSLILSFVLTHDAQQDITLLIERQTEHVQSYLQYVRNDVSAFNSTLRSAAESGVKQRKQRILHNQGRLASLGIPLKVRANSPKTFSPPQIVRKIAPTLPKISQTPFVPEPAMADEHYEHVIDVIQNMTMVMECSASEFANMGEETLRQHYLVQLNGHFVGQATGETFNASGKTDILLRIDGKNVFIAECKFWKGAKSYDDTIDQLLSYQAWRDTKTAILIFNRNRDTSKVVHEVKTRTELHANYKRTLDWPHVSGHRFVMHHPSDANRELVMTVLVFDIPLATT